MRYRYVLGAAVIAAATTPAFGADLAVKAPYYKAPPPVLSTWTGFYLGAVGSYGTGSASGSVLENGIANTGGNPPWTSVPLSGGFGGVEAGYNWQFGHLVTGIETDYEFGSLSGSGVAVANLGTSGVYSKTLNTSIENFGTTRLRIGYAAGNWLPFVTGGVAYANVSNSESVTCANPLGGGPFCPTTPIPWGGGSFSGEQLGYAVGGGAEYALGSGWSIKAEYLHLGFGSQSGTYNGLGGDVDNLTTPPKGAKSAGTHTNIDGLSGNLSADVVRLGINYKFW